MFFWHISLIFDTDFWNYLYLEVNPVPTICLISPAFYAFAIKISPAFYKILLNMLDYQIFIVSLRKTNNRGYNHEIFK